MSQPQNTFNVMSQPQMTFNYKMSLKFQCTFNDISKNEYYVGIIYEVAICTL